MAEDGQERDADQRMVADTGSQTARSLSVLRNKRKHTRLAALLCCRAPADAQMAQPSQSARETLAEAICGIRETLSAAAACNQAQSVYVVVRFRLGRIRLWRKMSSVEEPDVRNSQVRFREGH